MRTIATILSGLAFLASIAATTYLLNAPLYQVGGSEELPQDTMTLVEMNGTWVINQLVAAILVSGVPFFVALWWSAMQRLVTWICTLLLLAYSIAGSMTVGLFFMPGAVLLLLAAIATLFIRRSTDH